MVAGAQYGRLLVNVGHPPQMETVLVRNHNMMRLRIAGAEVFQVELIAIQVDRRQMQKLSTSLHDLYSHSAPLWH